MWFVTDFHFSNLEPMQAAHEDLLRKDPSLMTEEELQRVSVCVCVCMCACMCAYVWEVITAKSRVHAIVGAHRGGLPNGVLDHMT